MVMCQLGSCFLTKREALRTIEDELGFPDPKPFFLPWYFVQESGGWVPIVDFEGLAKDVKKYDLVALVSGVVGLSPSDPQKREVILFVRSIVDKHRFTK